MKFEVNIDEATLNEAVSDILVRDSVKEVKEQLFDSDGGRYSIMRRLYRESVQDEVRKLIKANSDAIIDKAVNEASRIIAKKALPKLLEKEI